ncbi:MAG: LysR family transcriptional regulator [Herminiimonas sp.]|jgi:LysR family glycine cleavage system transcriptional activator|nr:LysR family transcriptional regulator [Herminiimonas sp.]
MKNLPPLRSLVAFEAAARRLSFAQAADELHVTPGAVGQLIHKLEEWLGVKLFYREVRKVSLTEAGAAYFGRISTALGQISHASTVLKQRRHNEVRISMPPSFARKWFVPRMARFMDLYPDIALHIDTSAVLVDFDKEPTDIVIRHFKAQESSKLDIELLFLDELRVYCSQKYCEKLELKQPQNFAKATLLATTINPHWVRWLLQFTKLSDREIREIPTINFDASHLAVDTAKRHQGVVLTTAPLVEHEIESGELIEPFEGRLPVDEGYFLVGPKGSFALGGAVESLRVWLRQECRASH